jgi:hypothetical protein
MDVNFMGVPENGVYPPNGYFHRQNDNLPMDLGVHIFRQTQYSILIVYQHVSDIKH